MKGCFFLHRHFAYIGHYLACLLKEKYGIEQFCGYVTLRDSFEFLHSQKDIHYTSLLLDEEIHKMYVTEKVNYSLLEELEKKYGLPNLWPYLAADRVLMFSQLIREYPYNKPRYSHEEMLRILQVKARAIEDFLKKEKPDFLFTSEALGGVGNLLLYQIAKKMGIKTIVLMVPYLPNIINLSESYDGLSYAEGLFKNRRNGIIKQRYSDEARKLIKEFREQPRVYSAIHGVSGSQVLGDNPLTFLLPINIIRSGYWFLKLVLAHFTSSEKDDYTYINPWNYFKDRVARKFDNLRGRSDLYDSLNSAENFAYFPLHYEPEISLSLWAPFITDQINLIRQVARSLPVDYKLYVKEHPQMVPYRRRSYYKELKKVPNVKLIPPQTSSFELIKKAKLVVNISASSGWQAILLAKPLITFGNIFYNKLSFVKRCNVIEKLPELVKSQIENFAYDEDELMDLVAGILQESASLDLLYLWEREYDEAEKKKRLIPLADLLARKLNLDRMS